MSVQVVTKAVKPLEPQGGGGGRYVMALMPNTQQGSRLTVTRHAAHEASVLRYSFTTKKRFLHLGVTQSPQSPAASTTTET